MKTIKEFLKKYWITCCIFAGLVLLYVFLTVNKLVNPYLFPSTDKIKAAFIVFINLSPDYLFYLSCSAKKAAISS